MKWPWSKKQAVPPAAPAWPTDAYMSVKACCYFYSKQYESLPFRERKPPNIEVSPAIESTARVAVCGLQTRLYFYLLEQRIGKLEAEIAKDLFLGLLTQLSSEGADNDMGSMTRFLLRVVDDAANTAESQGGQKVSTPSGDVEVPPDYFMALHFLVRMSDSPYYNADADTKFNNDDWTLAQCLEHGKSAAATFFTPMVNAVASFDVNQFPEWAWRDKPGAHERHLQRRHKNLLFPAARRVVATADVLAARRKDAAEYKELVDKVRAIDMPETLPRNWNEYLSNIREQIDALKDRTRQIGGDTSHLVKYLNDTRRDMGNVWRACMKQNPEALRLYEVAEAAARERDEFFRGDFGNQLLRDDPCFPSDEVVPSLLCEDVRTVAAVWGMMAEANRATLDRSIADCIHDAMAEGFDIGTVLEHLLAIGWPRVPE
jgi:hypothetical protein